MPLKLCCKCSFFSLYRDFSNISSFASALLFIYMKRVLFYRAFPPIVAPSFQPVSFVNPVVMYFKSAFTNLRWLCQCTFGILNFAETSRSRPRCRAINVRYSPFIMYHGISTKISDNNWNFHVTPSWTRTFPDHGNFTPTRPRAIRGRGWATMNNRRNMIITRARYVRYRCREHQNDHTRCRDSRALNLYRIHPSTRTSDIEGL